MSKEEINKEVDDVRKSKLDSFKTLEEKDEYLGKVATSALFDEDTNIMFWCFTQRKYVYEEYLIKAKEIIKDFMLIAKVEHLKGRYETIDEAEQFLNIEMENL